MPYTLADGRSWNDAKDEYGERLVSLVRTRCSGFRELPLNNDATESEETA